MADTLPPDILPEMSTVGSFNISLERDVSLQTFLAEQTIAGGTFICRVVSVKPTAQAEVVPGCEYFKG